MPNLPRIDPRIEHIRTSRLRSMGYEALRNLENVLVIQDSGPPVAVLLPFQAFMRLQSELDRLLVMIETAREDGSGR